MTTRANCWYLLCRQIREWQIAVSRERETSGGAQGYAFRWVFLIQITIGVGAPVVGRLVWSSSHSIWSGYGAVFAVPVAAVAFSIVALAIRRVHRSGEAVRGVLLRRRQRARALVDSSDKLRALAPLAAGIFTLCSFPACGPLR